QSASAREGRSPRRLCSSQERGNGWTYERQLSGYGARRRVARPVRAGLGGQNLQGFPCLTINPVVGDQRRELHRRQLQGELRREVDLDPLSSVIRVNHSRDSFCCSLRLSS